MNAEQMSKKPTVVVLIKLLRCQGLCTSEYAADYLEDLEAENRQLKSVFDRIHKATLQFHRKKVDTVDDCPYVLILALYKKIMFNFPACRKLTNKRKAAMAKRWREDLTSLEDWAAYYKDASKKRFLMGNNDRGWKADFDFFLREDVIVKMQEGKYNA